MKTIDRLRGAWTTVWVGIRYPYRMKTAWINVGAWTVALATVGLTLTANAITRNFTWSWFSILVGIFDFVMLHRSIEGLLWRRVTDRALREQESKDKLA